MAAKPVPRIIIQFDYPLQREERERHVREMTDLQYQSVVETIMWISRQTYDVLADPKLTGSQVDHARGALMWTQALLADLEEMRTIPQPPVDPIL
jgi:hypothetical protein